MARKPYTLENVRPRRTVVLLGRTLAPRGRGRTSQLDVTEEDLFTPGCMRLLQRSRVQFTRGTMPDALAQLLFPEEEIEAVSAPVPVSKPTYLPHTPKKVETVAVKAEPSKLKEEVPKLPVGLLLSLEELEITSYRDLQKMAKELDLSAGGSSEDLIARILQAQDDS